MIVDFRLPLLGDNISSADVIKVLVKEGDKVEVDQVVVEIETDKATVEVPSDIAGIVEQVYVKEGTKATIGEPVISVETGNVEKNEERRVQNDEVKTKNDEVKSETVKQPEVVSANHQSLITNNYNFTVPTLGENITSAQITKVLLKVGDKVEVDQVVLEIETDKATVEVPSEVSGVVKEVNVKDGDKVTIGSVALVIERAIENGKLRIENEKPKIEEKLVVNQSPITNNQQPVTKEHTHMPQILTLPRDIVKIVVPAAPSVRRFAREIGVEINNVRGSGPSGRISIEDVKAFAKALNQQLQQGGAIGGAVVGVPRETLPDFSKWGEIDRQPMSNIRRKTAEHLSYAWATVPHVTQFDKADITELEKIRKQFGKQVEAAGGKLTVTGILLKVIASAMKVYPQFNSSVDMEKNEIIYKKYLNIGVAVDTEKGLLVPVIKDVDKKNITQISVDLAEVSKKARDKKLGLDDMQGGCFTISNLGGIGGTYFTPIVNTPEVAILGVSKSAYEPVYIDGEFKPRLMMPLSLSYDHRIIDGADAIRFLRWIVNALENPFLMSL
ncbi:MAG: pyruvate dehydrogenase E2 component [Stygiobacter sp.]|nr:MAG: pyruvate dehydrogenase E2 component [Stygiobacter sp.]KAF0210696.1 MAG: pyruvate dehydrogenase E2 [Ignavibacteria bacterium]